MEIDILRWINENLHGSNFINQIIRYITYLGDAGIMWLALSIILMCFSKTRKGGFIVFVGYCTVVGGNHFILKNIINRPRPFTEATDLIAFIEGIGMELPDSSSFPSGHTFASMCSAIILTLSFGKKGAWSYIPASLISLSRIFLCVHYPSDVLGGAVLGTLCGALVYWIMNILIDKFFDWRKKKQLVTSLEDEKQKEKDEESVRPSDEEDKEEGEEEEEKEPIPAPAKVNIE